MKLEPWKKIVQTESARKDKTIRCVNCIDTQNFCNNPNFVLDHRVPLCKQKTIVTSALLGGPHPSNDRGCEYYHSFYNKKINL